MEPSPPGRLATASVVAIAAGTALLLSAPHLVPEPPAGPVEIEACSYAAVAVYQGTPREDATARTYDALSAEQRGVFDAGLAAGGDFVRFVGDRRLVAYRLRGYVTRNGTTYRVSAHAGDCWDRPPPYDLGATVLGYGSLALGVIGGAIALRRRIAY